MRLHDTRIVLTGAASGIGRALLIELAAYPVHIVAVDKHGEALDEILSHTAQRQPRARLMGCVADLGQAAGVDRVFEKATADMGGIDLFIANAGFAYYEAFGKGPEPWERLHSIYSVNVLSPLYALARMRQLNEQRPYSFVITASAQSKIPLPGYAVYGSTKAALDAFASAYRFEQPANEHLMLVYPVSTQTGFFKAANIRRPPTIPPVQKPEQVARAVIWGLQHNRTHVYPSRPFSLGWMLNRALPVKYLTQQFAAWQFRRWLNAR